MREVRSPELTAWLSGFVVEAAQDSIVQTFVDRIDEVIATQIPEIGRDPILVQDLHRSTRAQWLAFLAHLNHDHRLALPIPAADLARSLARRGLELAILLKVYRVAQQSVFDFFTTVIDGLDDSGPTRDEVLVFIWKRAGAWMDDSVESLVETFYEERERVNAGAVARRSETIEALLGDTPPSADEATRALGHPLHQWQTALVLWSSEADAASMDAMVDVANGVAQSLGVPRPLAMVAGSRDLWCWLATPAAAEIDVASLEKPLAAASAHLAIGLPAPGVAGFRTSHVEARSAQRLVVGAPRTPLVVPYAEVELLCLAGGQDELLERMVAREIGALAGADKNLGLVRETVSAYFRTMNVEATAEQLFVHKNTVRYRLARAEELLGHPLTERSTHVELALRWVALFGAPQVD